MAINKNINHSPLQADRTHSTYDHTEQAPLRESKCQGDRESNNVTSPFVLSEASVCEQSRTGTNDLLIKICHKTNTIFFEVDGKLFKAKVTQDQKNKELFSVYLFNFNKNFIINNSAQEKILPTISTNKFESELKSPLCGRIIKINVEPGQAVLKNQVLIVIESMKMENEIRASGDLSIKNIFVKTGDLVQPNQILMEFGE